MVVTPRVLSSKIRRMGWDKLHGCHGEERSDEAISTSGLRDCFALLAMTFEAALWNDIAFAGAPYRLATDGILRVSFSFHEV